MKKPQIIILLVNLILVLTLFAYKNTYLNFTEATQVMGLFLLNILIGIVYAIAKNKERSKIYFLSAFLVLLIGLGVCSLKIQVYPQWRYEEPIKK